MATEGSVDRMGSRFSPFPVILYMDTSQESFDVRDHEFPN